MPLEGVHFCLIRWVTYQCITLIDRALCDPYLDSPLDRSPMAPTMRDLDSRLIACLPGKEIVREEKRRINNS